MTVDAAIVAVADFLTPILAVGTLIVRGQANSVPEPNTPLVVITEILQVQLETTVITPASLTSQASYLMPTRLDLQLDFYGDTAGDQARIAQTMLRSLYTVGAFPAGVTPLYCNDAIQAPLITGEMQFETRWTMTLSLQYNAAVIVGQTYFDQVGATELIPADIFYPVG